ncbi:MAG: DUF1269 domain-containing protein [Solirubrobacteraceae bacterium]
MIIRADQVAVISRDSEGDYSIHTSPAVPRPRPERSGGVWGLPFVTLFLIPFAGCVLGAGVGALFGHLRDKGIDRGCSSRRAMRCSRTLGAFHDDPACEPDKAIAAFEPYGGTVIKTSLSDEDAEMLQGALEAGCDRPGRGGNRMNDLIAIADPDEGAPRRAPTRLADAVEKGLVDVADAASSPATTTAGSFLFWAARRSDSPRPGGATAGGVIARDLVAMAGAPRESR